MAFHATSDWRKAALVTLGRTGLVLLAIFGLLIAGAFPVPLGKFGEIRPAFLLMAVYYWTIMRPEALPSPLVFVAGLLFDLLSGHPLGMNAMILIVAQWLVSTQRKFLSGQSFMVIWAGFSIVALGSAALQWLIFYFFYGNPAPLQPLFISMLMTWTLFPLLAPVFAVVSRALSDDPPPA